MVNSPGKTSEIRPRRFVCLLSTRAGRSTTNGPVYRSRNQFGLRANSCQEERVCIQFSSSFRRYRRRGRRGFFRRSASGNRSVGEFPYRVTLPQLNERGHHWLISAAVVVV